MWAVPPCSLLLTYIACIEAERRSVSLDRLKERISAACTPCSSDFKSIAFDLKSPG